MSKAIYQINVQSPNGLQLTAKGDFKVDGYNVMPVNLDEAAKPGATQTLDLGAGTSAIDFLFVKDLSDKYDGAITFTINGDTAVVALGGPLVLIGNAAVMLMAAPVTTGGTAVQPVKLKFTNARATAASLEVVIVRDPTV